MSYVKGLTTGDWTDFQNNVLKPLRKALEAVISFILDLVRAVFKPISDAIAAFLRALANGVLNVWARVIDEISKANPSAPYHGGVAGAILSIVLFGGGIIAIYAFCLGLAYADRKSTRLNSSHTVISYAVFYLLLRSFPTRRSSDLAIAAFLRALANGVLNVWARVIDEISKANPSAPYHGGVAGAILSIVLFGGGIIAIYAFCLGLAY